MKRLLTTIATAVSLSALMTSPMRAYAPKKPTLTLSSLTCLDTTEKSADRLELRVYFPDRRANFTAKAIMKKGQTWTLPSGKRPFDGAVRVELWEIDPELFGKDDKLGSCVIKPNEGGAWQVRFTAKRGSARYFWGYILKYRVDL